MSKLVLPLDHVDIAGLSTAAIEANPPVWICESKDRLDRLDAYQKIVFRVDPGAHFTSMGIDYAREVGLEVPEQFIEIPALTASGRTRERIAEGRLYTRIVGLEGYLIEWPCIFHENRPRTVPPLLGWSGVLQSGSGHVLRLSFDGTPAAGARHGFFTVEIISAPSPSA